MWSGRSCPLMPVAHKEAGKSARSTQTKGGCVSRGHAERLHHSRCDALRTPLAWGSLDASCAVINIHRNSFIIGYLYTDVKSVYLADAAPPIVHDPRFI